MAVVPYVFLDVNGGQKQDSSCLTRDSYRQAVISFNATILISVYVEAGHRDIILHGTNSVEGGVDFPLTKKVLQNLLLSYVEGLFGVQGLLRGYLHYFETYGVAQMNLVVFVTRVGTGICIS